MFSPSLQRLVVQVQIEELHRVAQTYNYHRAFAAPIQEVSRPNATRLSAGVKRAINRIVGGSHDVANADLCTVIEFLGNNPAQAGKFQAVYLLYNRSPMVIQALKKSGGIQAKAAKSLGITPRQIGYKIKKYRISSNFE